MVFPFTYVCISKHSFILAGLWALNMFAYWLYKGHDLIALIHCHGADGWFVWDESNLATYNQSILLHDMRANWLCSEIRLIVELSVSILWNTDPSLQVYLANVPPLDRWVPLCVCVLFALLLYCWHDEGNWSLGLVNQCQPGWADCIWWSCSDQMASWHQGLDWQGVYMYVRTCVCLCRGGVKRVWIAIYCDCSFRNILKRYACAHRDMGVTCKNHRYKKMYGRHKWSEKSVCFTVSVDKINNVFKPQNTFRKPLNLFQQTHAIMVRVLLSSAARPSPQAWRWGKALLPDGGGDAAGLSALHPRRSSNCRSQAEATLDLGLSVAGWSLMAVPLMFEPAGVSGGAFNVVPTQWHQWSCRWQPIIHLPVS